VGALSDSARENSPPRVLPVVLCALSVPYHAIFSYWQTGGLVVRTRGFNSRPRRQILG